MTSFVFLATWIRAHAKDDRAASLVEYALLVLGCIGALTAFGAATNTSGSRSGSSIVNAN